jgi:glycosyltransferase involved in cell wall biosynthesis
MELSIVVPVYRSADCLPELARRIREDVGRHFESYELILVNDCSPDDSWAVISKLAQEYAFVTGLNLRKNVGQDNAIMAGLRYSRGDVVIIMDDDLQHDPADIPRLYAEIQRGYDVVYAHFEEKKQAFWKNLGSWFADQVARLLLDKPEHLYMSPYKAIRRAVVEQASKYDGPFSYVDGLLFTITCNFTQIPATHQPRFAGTSNYNLVRSIRVWLKLATSFSVIPLRIASFAGGVIALFSFVMGFAFIVQAMFYERPVEGWPSLIVTVFFLGGIQLIGIGAVGEYIGRIYITLNKYPQFTVKEVCQGSRDADTAPPHTERPAIRSESAARGS